MTQDDLADLCGFSRQSITYIESGKFDPRGGTIARIMWALPDLPSPYEGLKRRRLRRPGARSRVAQKRPRPPAAAAS